MTTLAIDTSTAGGSVAVLADGELIVHESFLADRGHSSALFKVLDHICSSRAPLDQLVIGLGPGSYAGIRIAIAAGLGVQLGSRAKLIGIPSVAALPTNVSPYVAIGDARRETFYFTHIEEGICVEGPLLMRESELAERLAAPAMPPCFTSTPLPAFPAAEVRLPSAEILARLAAAGRGIVAREDLEPIYLREAHITQPRNRSAKRSE